MLRNGEGSRKNIGSRRGSDCFGSQKIGLGCYIETDPAAWGGAGPGVVSMMACLHCRDLDQSQLGMVAANSLELYEIYRAAAEERQREGQEKGRQARKDTKDNGLPPEGGKPTERHCSSTDVGGEIR